MSRKKETPDQLNTRIIAELGINLREYRDEEVAEKLVEILVFPVYAVSWVIRPVIVAFVMYIVGFFILDLVHIEYILYGIVGLVLLLACGIVFGILFFLNRLHSDVESIMKYSLDIADKSLEDLQVVKKNIGEDGKGRNTIKLLVEGVVKIVTVPVISKVLGNKIPLIGGLLAGSIEKMLLLMTSRFSFESDGKDIALETSDDRDSAIGHYSGLIDRMSNHIDSLMGIVMNVVRVPFRVVFFILMMITLIFIYLVN